MALTKIGKEGVTGISNSSNATAITIDSSENVGIGTTSPATVLHVQGADPNITIQDTNDTGDAFIRFKNNSGTQRSFIQTAMTADVMLFGTGGSERMRIDSSGNVLVGTTSTTPNPGVSLAPAGAVGIGNSAQGSGWGFIEFRRSATQIGGIIQSGTTGVSYNTSSDYRLKENVTATWDATTRLKQLNPVRFNFIADANTTVDGFLAHEVQTVVPEAISGTHNEVDDEGNPVYQGIDQSKLVPLLVKTIQELEARIVVLENA